MVIYMLPTLRLSEHTHGLLVVDDLSNDSVAFAQRDVQGYPFDITISNVKFPINLDIQSNSDGEPDVQYSFDSEQSFEANLAQYAERAAMSVEQFKARLENIVTSIIAFTINHTIEQHKINIS